MNDAAIFVRIPGPDAPRPRPRTLRRPRATVASPALVASLLASAWVAVLFRLAVRLHRLDDRVAPIGVDLVPPPSAVVVPPDRGVGRDEGADLGGRAGRPPLSTATATTTTTTHRVAAITRTSSSRPTAPATSTGSRSRRTTPSAARVTPVGSRASPRAARRSRRIEFGPSCACWGGSGPRP